MNRVLKCYRCIADRANDWRSIIRLVPVSVTFALLTSLALCASQSIEAIRILAIDLNWHHIAITYFCILGCAASLWYNARIILYQLSPSALGDPQKKGAAHWVPRIIGCFPLFAFSLCCLGAESDDLGVARRLKYMGVGGFALCVIFLVLLVLRGVLVNRTRVEIAIKQRESERQAQEEVLLVKFKDLPTSTKWVVLLQNLGLAVVFLAACFNEGTRLRGIGAVGILMLAGATWCPLFSGIYYLGRKYRFPALSVLILGAFLFSLLDWNDNHELRQTSENVPRTRKDPIPLNQAFATWINSRNDFDQFDKDYPVFIVATEGGGIRAAYNTAVILSTLQDRCPSFAQHVFAISGVSGGSVGAAVFSGLSSERAKNESSKPVVNWEPENDEYFTKKSKKVLDKDFISPLLAKLLFPDLVQRFLPFRIPSADRARALERGLERSWQSEVGSDLMAKRFEGLGNPSSATPGLLLNTTIVETGDRFVLGSYAISDNSSEKLQCQYSSLFKDSTAFDINLSTAAFASARFTFFTPAASVTMCSISAQGERTPWKLRLVDAGYYENSGCATLAKVLDAIDLYALIAAKGRVSAKSILIFAIVISSPDAPLGPQVDEDVEGNLTDGYEHWLGECMSPIRALLGTRGARGRDSVESLQTALTKLTEWSKIRTCLIRFNLNDRKAKIPLGWTLSDESCKNICDQLGYPDRSKIKFFADPKPTTGPDKKTNAYDKSVENQNQNNLGYVLALLEGTLPGHTQDPKSAD
jgi:uncharacterized membrane protein (GlpM family)